MTRIALVVSDVDGTLLTKDKTLTDGARRAVRRLHEAGIGFTITSSRPTIGMGFLIEPLQIALPVGPFNGSSIVDPQLNPLEQHLIPAAAAQTSLDLLNEFGVDIWLFTNEKWLTRRPDGEYVPHEKLAIRADPTIVADFTPYLAAACKIVGAIRRGCAAPFVVAPERGGTSILGYYTLSSYGVDIGEFPADVAKTLPRYPLIPATLLGRLAVDRRYQGQGIGEFLLLDALRRALGQSAEIAAAAVVVEAIDGDAVKFYQHFGFVAFPSIADRLFLPMKAVSALFR